MFASSEVGDSVINIELTSSSVTVGVKLCAYLFVCREKSSHSQLPCGCCKCPCLILCFSVVRKRWRYILWLGTTWQCWKAMMPPWLSTGRWHILRHLNSKTALVSRTHCVKVIYVHSIPHRYCQNNVWIVLISETLSVWIVALEFLHVPCDWKLKISWPIR